MKPPRRIVVGPHEYRVIHDHAAMSEECRGGDDLLGRCCNRTLTIYVEPEQAPSQKRDTVLHEVLHAVASVTGLSSEWGDDREEEFILRLTPSLLDALRRNPRLVAYLTA